MNLYTYHNPFPDGKRWKITSDGIKVEGEGLIRSKGEPKTILTLWEDFGMEMLQASFESLCPLDMLVAMIPIEAARIKGTLKFDPESNRFEPGYISDTQTPHRRSVGLGQTLISTAAQMNKLHDFGLNVTSELLKDPYYSLLLSGAYITYQTLRYRPDPVLICGAYNAGSLRHTMRNEWRILTYGPTRMDRYVSWFNDFHYCVRQGLIDLPSNVYLSTPPRNVA